MSFFNELKRRNVLRVGAAYVVSAWLLIQVVETIFPAFGFGDAAVRFVTIACAAGLVPVLVLAWVFEITPEGLKRDADADSSRPASLQNAKRLDRMILAVLAVALGYFAFDRFILVPQEIAEEVEAARQEGRNEAQVESYGDLSIVVLPFTDMSAGHDQEYFSDGITEEILNLLTRIPELRVTSRSSAFSFKGKNVDIPTIASQLNVAHVLEGSVRKAGNMVRITAQLIDARTDTHLWSQTYDRSLDDIFAIQDEIAAAMVEQMKISLLGGMPHSRKINPDAYALYLQGKYLVNERISVEVDKQAIDLLKQALEMEPQFADAWTVLSLAYAFLWVNEREHAGEQAAERIQELDRLWYESLANALKADPDHPAANAYVAWDTLVTEGDYAKAGRQFERALALDPYDWEVMRSSILYSIVIGRYDIPSALGKIASSRNPLCAPCHYSIARQLFKAGDYESAEKSIRMAIRLRPPDEWNGYHVLGLILLMKGDLAGAKAAFERSPTEAEREHGSLLLAITEGRTGGIGQKIAEFDTRWGERSVRFASELYALSGNKDKAFESFTRFQKGRSRYEKALALRNPLFKSLEGDPRWQKLLEEAGIAPSQLAEIRFNPRLPAPKPASANSDLANG